jgi:hypothetical protein
VPVEEDAHLRAVDRIIEIAGELAGTRRQFHTSPLSLRLVAPSRAYASMMHGRTTMNATGVFDSDFTDRIGISRRTRT